MTYHFLNDEYVLEISFNIITFIGRYLSSIFIFIIS